MFFSIDEFKKLCIYGPGYVEPDLNNPNQELPQDINECLIFTGLCKNGRCVNTDGGYRCDCAQGFKADSAGTKCIDIDECVENPCGNGTCLNTFGSFECNCHLGFRPSHEQICEGVLFKN